MGSDSAIEPTVLFRFTLPAALLLGAQPGRFTPCLHKVRVDIGADGAVAIACYDAGVLHSTGQVIEQALRFLKQIAGRNCHLVQAIPAELTSAARPGRVEYYSIAIGAAVSITASRSAPAMVA